MNQATVSTKGMASPKKNAITLPVLIGIFLALAPVLDPYILFNVGSGITIRINDIFAVSLAFLAFCEKNRMSKQHRFLIGWCFAFLLLTMLAFLGVDKNLNMFMSLKNIMIWFLYSVLVGYLWNRSDGKTFFSVLEKIAIVASIVVFLQFFAGAFGFPMWNGKIPLLSLSEYDGWAGFVDRNTGDIRPNGIFQEASYVGIYCLIAYVNVVKKNKFLPAVMLIFAMILTSSLVAVFGVIISTAIMLIFSKNIGVDKKAFRKLIIVVLVVCLMFLILLEFSDALRETQYYLLKRFQNLEGDVQGDRMSSTKLRLIGNLGHFSEYGLWQRMFGVGAAQYPAYLGVIPYSNNFVNALLDYGILGFVLFCILLIKVFFMTEKENRIFFLVLILVFASDRQWFNWYFFYLLSACVLNQAPQLLPTSSKGEEL